MKVALFDAKPYERAAFEAAEGKYGIQFVYYETRLNADTAPLAAGADGVSVFVHDRADRETIEKLCSLGVKTVALRSAGYNNVDVAAAYGKIHVTHVPAYSPYAVAEHAMALLLTSVRRIHKAYIRTRDFNFSLAGLTGFDLHGKTVGVIGTGRIGRAFIDICRGFGMKILAYDKFPAEDAGLDYVTLDELFEKSDVISFHCPLTEETYHLLNADAIEKCKRGVVILNTSRGALIDAEALLAGIKARKIGAACLDVYEEEADIFFEDFSGHIVDDDLLARLISMPNVIVTSHQAFLTAEALSNIAETTCENMRDILLTGRSKNELCYRCGKIGRCRSDGRDRCF